MQRACDLSASGLYFVHGIQLEDLREKCKEILEKRKAEKPNFDTFIDVVIDSYPKGGVIGATVDCEKDLLALAANKVHHEGHFTPKNLVRLWQKSFCLQEKSIKNP